MNEIAVLFCEEPNVAGKTGMASTALAAATLTVDTVGFAGAAGAGTAAGTADTGFTMGTPPDDCGGACASE